MSEIYVEDAAKRFSAGYSADYQLNQGASLIIIHDDGVLFTLVKPKHWRNDGNGEYTIDFSGIGGSLEKGETMVSCLERELVEEVQVDFNYFTFAYPSSTFIINTDQTVITANIKEDNGNPSPIYINQLILPLRKDINHGDDQKKESVLQLFVYLAKLRGDSIPVISSQEEITALFHVKKEMLQELLSGNIRVINKENPSGVTIYWNEHLNMEIPKNIVLQPKFTPKGLITLGLSFDQLDAYFSTEASL